MRPQPTPPLPVAPPLPIAPLGLIAPLLLAALAVVAAADEPGVEPYRRVYAPADRPDAWPKTTDAWVPVARDEVARLLNGPQLSAPQADDAAERLTVRARVSQSTLTAEGELTVELHGRPEAFLPWPTGQTPVRSASWASDQQPAVLGDWGGGPNPPHGLLIDRAGVLSFELSGSPVSETATRAEYLLGLPAAATTTVTLDLPAGVTPTVDRGIVEAGPPDDNQTEAAGDQRWVIRVAPGGPLRIVLAKPTPAAAAEGPGFDATQQVTHTIDEAGVVSHCRFHLTAARELPGAVRLIAPPGASLIGATQDSLPVTWTLREEEAAETVIRVALKRSSETECDLELVFAAPWEPGQEAALPMPVLLGAHWKEGSAEVRLSEPLELIDIAELTHAHRQPTPPEDQDQAALSLRLSRPNASVRLQVASRTAAIEASVARRVTLTIDPQRDLLLAQSTVTLAVDNPAEAPRHELRATLDRNWRLTSVEATPSSILESWDDVQHGGKRVAVMRLAPSAAENAGAAVTLQLARRVRRGDEGVALTELLGVGLSGARIRADSLTLTTAAPYRLRLQDAPSPANSADTPEGSVRFETGRTPLRALLAGGVAEVISDRTPPPGRCAVRVANSDGEWTYRAELTAPATEGGQLALVRFEPPLPESAVLSVGDRVLGRSALLVSPRDDSFPVQAGMLALPLEESGPTRFRIDFSLPNQAPLDIPLPSLDGVSVQRGVLTLAGAGRGSVGLRSSGLTPAASDAAGDSELRFTFDPNRVGALDLSAIVTRQQTGPAELPLRLRDIETRVLANGRLVHHVRYRLRPTNREQTLPLPAGAVLLGAQDGLGLPIAQDINSRDQGVLAFAAAAEPRDVSLTLESIGQGWSPGAPLPLAGLHRGAAAGWVWRVYLPSSYDLGGPSCAVMTDYGRRQSRLLGPVAGVLRAGGLNPFVPRTWWPTETASRSGEPWSALNCPPGWRCYEIPCVGSTTPDLVVRHHDQLVGGAATLGVLVACLSAWRWPRTPRLLVTVALSSAVLALLLPATLAVWAASVWLGLIAGAMLGPLVRAAARLAPLPLGWRAPLTVATPTTPTTATSLGVLLAAAVFTAPTAAAPPDAPPLPTVLIPVNADAEPVGDKWYLEGEFLNRLRQANGPRSSTPAEWALNRVTLQGALRGPLAAAGGGAEPWQMIIEVTTRRRDTVAELPLRRGDAAWPDKADVDGIAEPIEWDSSGDGCAIRIAEPGRRRIALTFTPVIEVDEILPEIQLSLPRCSRSLLRLAVSDAVTPVRAPGLAAPLQRSAGGDEVVADLSGEDHLVLQWQAGAESAQVGQALCDQQQWLRVTPNGASIEVRCVLEGTAPLPRQLRFADAGSQPMADELLLAPLSDWDAKQTKLTYTGRFPLDRESGYGRYSIAAASPANVTVRSRLMAFTAARGLSVTTPATSGVATFDADEFALRWNQGESEPDEAPDRAFVASTVSARWEVQSDPRPTQLSIDEQSLRLVVGQDESTARLTVASNRSGWPLGKLDIDVPASFELLDCRLVEGAESTPLRATRPSPTRAVVFATPTPGALTESATASGPEVRLYGRIDVTAGRPTPLPVLRATVAQAGALAIDLWRTPDSLVRLAAEHTAALDPPTTPRTQRRETMVGSVRLLPGQAVPEIVVSNNNLGYRVSHVTAHQRTPAGVRHRIAATVRVVSGEVSELPLQLADDSPTFKLVAPEGGTLTAAPLEGVGRWRISLPTPLRTGQAVEVQLESRQESVPGEHSAVMARFPDAQESDSLVALHAGPHLAEGRWLTENLAPASGRHEAPTVAFAGPGWTLYQANRSSRAGVAWTRRDKRRPECIVRLTETTATPDPLGRLAITARLLVDPNGATFCRLQLDEASELAAIEVDGRGPVTTRESPGVWRVTLLNRRTPQLLSVTALWTRPAGRQVVMAPQLVSAEGEPIEPEKAMVELVESPAARLRIATTGDQITADEQSILRLQAMLEHPPRAGEESAWWLSRLRDAKQSVEAVHRGEESRRDQTTDQGGIPAVASSDSALLAAADKQLAAEFTYQPKAEAAPIDGERRLITLPSAGPELTITVDARRATDLAGRVVLALVAAAAAVGYHAVCQRPEVIGVLEQRHNTVVALGGLAWWLWLPLPACGLLLMAAAAVAEAQARYCRILSNR
ncbi:hypothetical protein Pla123a_36260 [Posidoniimonas polymericola]|uniref:Uncharacterized protein n=1 Tax=Posidoniimonas polymericola TaxID=2528002 RepID=A0A5C5YFX1_9BACT|nr:hypothetical protein [Posidoniimonas polymericola]TWT73733.1 hypothetical protein Pla123a_36260 [Posidoniimonas polymericola]